MVFSAGMDLKELVHNNFNGWYVVPHFDDYGKKLTDARTVGALDEDKINELKARIEEDGGELINKDRKAVLERRLDIDL